MLGVAPTDAAQSIERRKRRPGPDRLHAALQFGDLCAIGALCSVHFGDQLAVAQIAVDPEPTAPAAPNRMTRKSRC